jgi:hypothetical protein
MLLAVLSVLDGLIGGANGGAESPFTPVAAGWLDSEAGFEPGVPVREGGPDGGPDPEKAGPEPDVGGRIGGPESPVPLDAREGGPDGGPIAALATLLGPFGGGGVAATCVAASGPAFLLTHFFRFSS